MVSRTSQESIIVLKMTCDIMTALFRLLGEHCSAIAVDDSKSNQDTPTGNVLPVVLFIYVSMITRKDFQADLVPHVLVNLKLTLESISGCELVDKDLLERVIVVTVEALSSRVCDALGAG